MAEEGDILGKESSLSNWAGDYVTDMLGKGAALGSEGYQGYTGPLTAGASDLQTSAFQGIGGLNIPTENMGAFTPQTFTAQSAADYMNPYLMASLQSNLAGITGAGYSNAYDNAMNQFNIEQDRARGVQDDTNKYGLGAIQKLYELGTAKRGIEAEGVAADQAQFKEERDYPYKQVQYMQSLLQGLPVEAQQYATMGVSDVDTATKNILGMESFFRELFKAQEADA